MSASEPSASRPYISHAGQPRAAPTPTRPSRANAPGGWNRESVRLPVAFPHKHTFCTVKTRREN